MCVCVSVCVCVSLGYFFFQWNFQPRLKVGCCLGPQKTIIPGTSTRELLPSGTKCIIVDPVSITVLYYYIIIKCFNCQYYQNEVVDRLESGCIMSIECSKPIWYFCETPATAMTTAEKREYCYYHKDINNKFRVPYTTTTFLVVHL